MALGAQRTEHHRTRREERGERKVRRGKGEERREHESTGGLTAKQQSDTRAESSKSKIGDGEVTRVKREGRIDKMQERRR
mmetsp:Transcript_10046/g.26520  ORF Transcript_10046/g.26520 Transcript_10046/m.26520 type:complete len:80 (-) Transcript_10046:37-276(-)